MTFPISNQRNICILVGNDAGGIVSALKDVKNVAILELVEVSRIFALTSKAIDFQHEKYEQRITTDPVTEISKILQNEQATNVLLLFSGDASVMLPLDHGLHDVLLNQVKSGVAMPISKEIIVLADMCQSGCFLGFSRISVNSTVSKNAIYCITACDVNEMDQDDISDMGFDGGLTSDFIDYLKLNNNILEIFEFYKFRETRNLAKDPPIHSIFSCQMLP